MTTTNEQPLAIRNSYKSSSATLHNHNEMNSKDEQDKGRGSSFNFGAMTSIDIDTDIETLRGSANYSEKTEQPPEDAGNDANSWPIVAGTFLVLLVGLGTGGGWGIMQNYFEHEESLQGTSNLAFRLSFVGSMINIIINLLGPLGQVLTSVFQPRVVLFISIVITSLGLLLASFSTKIWQLYLTQGLVYGVGNSIMFFMALTIVPLWFTKNRGIAMGIISSGISIGGLVMPLIMEPLNSNLGAAWCYRIMSLICLVVGIFSCVIIKKESSNPTTDKSDPEMKQQEKSDDAGKINFKEMFDFSVAKDGKFLLWVFIDILLESAYNVPYFFLPSYATHLGLSTSQGAVVLSTCAGVNAIGRIVSGIIADYVGYVNVIVVYSTASGLSCFFLWMYATTFPTLIGFAIVFGFFGGAFLTLTPTITLLVTGEEKFESGISIFLMLTVVSMFGPNLASAIEANAPAAKEYDSYKYFTGVCYLAGATLLVVFKLILNRNPLAKI